MTNKAISAKHEAWAALEERLGYHFRDSALLCKAMCHRSFVNENPDEQLADNERLEFLGDAVLDLVIGHRLVEAEPKLREGELTRLRAEVVAEPSLADLSRSLGLGDCLLLGRGELRSGGQNKPSLLSDAFEALLGAIFLDGGFSKVAEVILPLFEPRLRRAAGNVGQDYKSRLQELLQGRQANLPVYNLVEVSGPDHERAYQVEVEVDGKVCGSGHGRTKKRAEQAAARAALEALGADG